MLVFPSGADENAERRHLYLLAQGQMPNLAILGFCIELYAQVPAVANLGTWGAKRGFGGIFTMLSYYANDCRCTTIRAFSPD